jgi:hypothetical protein
MRTSPPGSRTGPTRTEWGVAIFTCVYVAGFTLWFIAIGNHEFIVYVLTMLGLIALVGLSLRSAAYPPAMLWALSVWGLAHMAGGGVRLDDSVLYNLQLVPIVVTENIFILKYDQLVHAFGFGVTAWLLWHLLVRHYPATRGHATAFVYPVLAAMGLGALNEMIEFSAVVFVPDTNVGGYYNTALDLVFNATGALVAMLLVTLAGRRTG